LIYRLAGDDNLLEMLSSIPGQRMWSWNVEGVYIEEFYWVWLAGSLGRGEGIGVLAYEDPKQPTRLCGVIQRRNTGKITYFVGLEKRSKKKKDFEVEHRPILLLPVFWTPQIRFLTWGMSRLQDTFVVLLIPLRPIS